LSCHLREENIIAKFHKARTTITPTIIRQASSDKHQPMTKNTSSDMIFWIKKGLLPLKFFLAMSRFMDKGSL